MYISLGRNIPALKAQRHLAESTNRLASIYQRLASGERISYRSDPAGMAVADALRHQAKLHQLAKNNINDGLSLVSIAEAALNSQSEILLRLEELATQSSNGTFSDAQRNALDAEYQALILEIDRIGSSSEFNGLRLIDGSNPSLTLQTGIGGAQNDGITLNLRRSLADSPGTANLQQTNISSAEDALQALAPLKQRTQELMAQRTEISVTRTRLEINLRLSENSQMNLIAAESRIRHADIAEEVAALVKEQIIQQVAAQVLRLASQQPAIILQLLSF